MAAGHVSNPFQRTIETVRIQRAPSPGTHRAYPGQNNSWRWTQTRVRIKQRVVTIRRQQNDTVDPLNSQKRRPSGKRTGRSGKEAWWSTAPAESIRYRSLLRVDTTRRSPLTAHRAIGPDNGAVSQRITPSGVSPMIVLSRLHIPAYPDGLSEATNGFGMVHKALKRVFHHQYLIGRNRNTTRPSAAPPDGSRFPTCRNPYRLRWTPARQRSPCATHTHRKPHGPESAFSQGKMAAIRRVGQMPPKYESPGEPSNSNGLVWVYPAALVRYIVDFKCSEDVPMAKTHRRQYRLFQHTG